MAAGFQEAAVEVLVEKVSGVVRREKLPAVSVSGGVAANSYLRRKLAERRKGKAGRSIPARKYCTDNAAMIACAAASG